MRRSPNPYHIPAKSITLARRLTSRRANMLINLSKSSRIKLKVCSKCSFTNNSRSYCNNSSKLSKSSSSNNSYSSSNNFTNNNNSSYNNNSF